MTRKIGMIGTDNFKITNRIIRAVPPRVVMQFEAPTAAAGNHFS